MNFKIAFAAAAFVAISTTVALAVEEFVLEKTVEVPSYDFGDRKIDILGLAPGATPDEVKAVVSDRLGGVKEWRAWMGTQQVSSQKYIAKMESEKGALADDFIVAHFVSPSAGNVAYNISRSVALDIESPRPTLDEMMAQLIEKYGEPTSVDIDEGRSGRISQANRSLIWVFGDKDTCGGEECKPNFHVGVGGYDPSEFERYVKYLETGPDYFVYANIKETPLQQDNRVRFLEIKIVDLKLRGLTAKADIEKIAAAQKAFESQAPEIPDL